MAFYAKAADLSKEYLEKHVWSKLKSQHEKIFARGSDSVIPAENKQSAIHGTGIFATRDLKIGEVFQIRGGDMMKLSYMNDGAYFSRCRSGCTLSKTTEFYDLEIGKYRVTSAEKCNVRLYPIDDELRGRISGDFEILKDIKCGEEMLSSYGITSWIVMLPNRLCSPVYRQWVRVQFPLLLADANERVRFEAECTILGYMMRAEPEWIPGIVPTPAEQHSVPPSCNIDEE